jgi:hypothetical protein
MAARLTDDGPPMVGEVRSPRKYRLVVDPESNDIISTCFANN